MPADVDIFPAEGNVGVPFLGSLALHIALFALALFGYLIPLGRGESWGGTTGGAGAISATLVSSIPLPRPPTETQNVLANESKGLTQSLPKETPKEEPKAIPIPERETKHKGPRESTQKKLPKELAEEDNRIPFGEGGPVSGPYGSFSAGGARGGLSFTGGTGDFGSRFGWYVDAVRRKVSENWLKYEVDPRVDAARRVYIYFEITRSGTPENIRVEQSSGVPSLDLSALRALQRIDTFGPLPQEYSGRYVAVEFWFDYQR